MLGYRRGMYLYRFLCSVAIDIQWGSAAAAPVTSELKSAQKVDTRSVSDMVRGALDLNDSSGLMFCRPQGAYLLGQLLSTN